MPRLTKARKELLTTRMKEAIFEAATSVLNAHGPNGVTMDRVAKAADVARSSLYDYFRDKDELFQFMACRITEPIYQAIGEIVRSDARAIDKLASIYRTVLTNLGKHQGLLGLLTRDEHLRGELDTYKKNARTSGVVVGLLAKVFEQGVAEGQFRPADPVVLARMFIGCGSALVDMQLDSGVFDEEKTVELQVAAQMDLFLHGIAAHHDIDVPTSAKRSSS